MITVSPKKGLFEIARRLAKQGTEGILVSGGSRSSDLEPRFYEYCCSLTWTDL